MKRANTRQVRGVKYDKLIIAIDVGMEMNRGYCTTPDGSSTKPFKFDNTKGVVGYTLEHDYDKQGQIAKQSPESLVREIRRGTRRKFNSEEKIRIILEGLRGEESIANICRKEGIAPGIYYKWSKAFLAAGKRQLSGDTVREANRCLHFKHSLLRDLETPNKGLTDTIFRHISLRLNRCIKGRKGLFCTETIS